MGKLKPTQNKISLYLELFVTDLKSYLIPTILGKLTGAWSGVDSELEVKRRQNNYFPYSIVTGQLLKEGEQPEHMAN